MIQEFTPMQVMVIDDDENARSALGMLLEGESYGVTLCAGGCAALERLRTATQPDLIVLDLVMPEMTGWEFRIEQKKEPAWASIPVLALSGDHSAQAEAATAYLSKPVQDSTFLEAVRRIVTDLQQKREVARASEFQRLVSLGSLIGGIAHEINNPLAFIDGSLDLLGRQLARSVQPSGGLDPLGVASAMRALERSKAGVARIAEVVRCVSLFASADPHSSELLDIHAVLESSLQVADNEIRHCALLERDYGELPRMHGNPAKLGQVFLNVLLNAVRAVRATNERGHLITVRTETESERIVVTISDTASRPSDMTSRALFEPLGAVAGDRLGLHFGLAVSREVVESMGGTIEVQHKHTKGAAFRMVLPSSTQQAYPPPATQRLIQHVQSRARVMIVDDDPLLCELLSLTLASYYEVTAFTSPHAALAVLLEGNVDIILCDVMMPELSGIDLYERVARESAELTSSFIFMTGGAFTERARMFLRRIDRPVINKPFARRELFEAIGCALAAQGVASTDGAGA